ncbi:MAG: monovalent cation/H(+) antiporter subunit G [Defluviitaleaceae bacterium]|nr:monovalent cation/H(+) antiporter subunit G [Defluviitaleaceae bacterium]
MMMVLSYTFIVVGLIFMFFGAVSLFKMKNFYSRILVASKIDTVGLMTLFIGFMLRHGFSFFTGKLLFILIIMLILNPLIAHMVARSAYLSGYETSDDADTEPEEEVL